MRDALATLERLGNHRVLVVGDLMLDRYIWGCAGRISPEAPVPVLRADLDEVRLGGAACVAHLLRGLGAYVSVSGVAGDDHDGRTLRRLMDESQIDHSLVIDDPNRITTCKERIIGRSFNRHGHQLVRVDREDDRPINREQEDRLLAGILDRLPDHDAVLISDYRKGTCSPRLLRSVLLAAGDLRIPALVDPGRGADYSRYRGAAMLKPNRLEAEIASGLAIRSAGDALTAGRLLCQQSRVEAVVITLDAEGMALVPAGGRGTLLPTRQRTVHDVTGAGDMALAMLGLCRAAGIDWTDAVYLANVAAGVEVERFGASQVTRDELIALVASDERQPATKVLPLQSLLACVQDHRRQGRRIVLTNGCFDLLHVGHVRCLQEAATLGDLLLVAINSDPSVRRLKGPGRPIVGERDRAAMLAALACVDYVTIFGADTPRELLLAIKPDVLVKGGSCAANAVEGRDLVAAQGGEVRMTGRVRGVSTTAIVSTIRKGTRK